MEKTISANQAGLIFSVFTISLKLSALPALMFTYAGNDSYVACFIALVFDMLGTLVILHIMHKHPDKSFNDIIKESFGIVVSKILTAILLIYFFAKCILVLQELHDYFIATLFEELSPILFLVILTLLILFVTTKNFRTMGRVLELIFWPTFIAIVFTLIFPTEDMQIEKLLPIFEQGFTPIYTALSRTTFAFGDFMILLPLMGKVVTNKKSKRRILFYAFGAFQFISSFFVIFVGSFGKFSLSQTLALGELPLHNTTPATIGKLEWMTIIVWTVILLTSSLIIAVACRECFDNLFNISGKKLSGYVVTGIIMLIVTFTYLQLETIIEVAVSPIFSTISGGIQAGIVIALFIAHLIKNKKNKQTPTLQKHNKELQKC